MRKWARKLTGLLLGLAVALYCAAKVHFFSRYDPNNVRGYIVEHSFFWVGMAVIIGLLWLATYLTEKGQQAGSEGGNP